MQRNLRRNFLRVGFLPIAFLSILVSALAVTPHYSCGCGKVEKGTKLTIFIDQITKFLESLL